MPFRIVTQSAAVHNALRALAEAVANELEISPDCIEEFCEELMCEAGEVCDDMSAGVTPDMLCSSELNPPAGGFGETTPSHNDDANAHGFFDTHTTDAAW